MYGYCKEKFHVSHFWEFKGEFALVPHWLESNLLHDCMILVSLLDENGFVLFVFSAKARRLKGWDSTRPIENPFGYLLRRAGQDTRECQVSHKYVR